MAWKALNNFGDSAFNEYWEEQKPPPIRCEKNCQCGPEKYLATFDWDNETVVYYEVSRAISTSPRFLSLAIILSSIYLIWKYLVSYFVQDMWYRIKLYDFKGKLKIKEYC